MFEFAAANQVFGADDFRAGSGCVIGGAGLKAVEAVEKGVRGTGVGLSVGVRKGCARAAATNTATEIGKGVVL